LAAFILPRLPSLFEEERVSEELFEAVDGSNVLTSLLVFSMKLLLLLLWPDPRMFEAV